MHALASLNLSLEKADRLTVSPLSSGFLYGRGVFTTLAIYDREPFLWEKHWARLRTDSAILGIDISEFTQQTTINAVEDLIAANHVTNGRARITMIDESASDLWHLAARRKASLLIMTADLRPRPQNLRVAISPYPINSASCLAGVKSSNYVEQITALSAATSLGMNEGLRTNQRGEVASACMANVFWLSNGKLFTPSLKTGCLPGTTREFVLENLECEEVEVEIDAIRSADEIFLTSAGIGVIQVAEFDGRRLDGKPHTITGLMPVYE